MDWSVYITITRLPKQDRTTHLYSACDPTVQHHLITSKPVEKGAIDTIKSLVTKYSNPMVHHGMTFHTIKQDNRESIQDFLICLQAASPDCEFNCPGCQYDLSNIYICDQFVRCLQNRIVQTDILTNTSQLKTLADVVKHAQSTEAAIQDQSHLENKHPVKTVFAAHQSVYQLQKNSTSYKSSPTKPKTSIGCGSNQHNQSECSTKCPAWPKHVKIVASKTTTQGYVYDTTINPKSITST